MCIGQPCKTNDPIFLRSSYSANVQQIRLESSICPAILLIEATDKGKASLENSV